MISIPEVYRRWPTHDACVAHLETVRWGFPAATTAHPDKWCEHGLEVCLCSGVQKHCPHCDGTTAEFRKPHHTNGSPCIPAKEVESDSKSATADAHKAPLSASSPCSTCGSTDGVPRWRHERRKDGAENWHTKDSLPWTHKCEMKLFDCQPCPTCSSQPKPEAAGVMTREKLHARKRQMERYNETATQEYDAINTALSLYDRAEAAERKLAETKPAERVRATYLTVNQYYALQVAVEPVRRAFGTVLIVGSVLARQDWRDVDLRVVFDDAHFLLEDPARKKFLAAAISDWLTARSGLPIDFQFQSYTEANAAENDKPRNAVSPLPQKEITNA